MALKNDKKQVYARKAEIIQAIAHPIRLEIIEFLSLSPQCVCNIVEQVQAGRSNISRHLSLMLKAGVLDCRKDGLNVIYSIKTPCILKFISCIEQVVKEKIQSDAAVLQALE